MLFFLYWEAGGSCAVSRWIQFSEAGLVVADVQVKLESAVMWFDFQIKLKWEQYSGISVFLCELTDLSLFIQILTLPYLKKSLPGMWYFGLAVGILTDIQGHPAVSQVYSYSLFPMVPWPIYNVGRPDAQSCMVWAVVLKESRVDRVKEIITHLQSHMNIPKLSICTSSWVVEVIWIPDLYKPD